MPSEESCIVLRRRKLDKDGKKVPGWIDVSREQVFDAIDEWHQGHVHKGQERRGPIVGPSISMSPSNL